MYTVAPKWCQFFGPPCIVYSDNTAQSHHFITHIPAVEISWHIKIIMELLFINKYDAEAAYLQKETLLLTYVHVIY